MVQFCNVIADFVDSHGIALDLPEEEIQYTKKVWFNYLKNLNN